MIVHTAGAARTASQDRMDLALTNARIVADAAEEIGRQARNAKLFMVTNPVDVMTSVALRQSGFRPGQVFGLGTHLDSMRLKSLIAQAFQVHVSEVHTRIIGEHGSSMVPLWSATTIGGIRIDRLPSFKDLPMARMVEAVRASGETIIRHKGSTVYGPGEAIATLVRTVLGDENRILTVSAYLRSEVHDIGGVCIGVPARVNRQGVTPIAIRLDDDEVAAFRPRSTASGPRPRSSSSGSTGSERPLRSGGAAQRKREAQVRVTSRISARSTPGTDESSSSSRSV